MAIKKTVHSNEQNYKMSVKHTNAYWKRVCEQKLARYDTQFVWEYSYLAKLSELHPKLWTNTAAAAIAGMECVKCKTIIDIISVYV